MPEVVEVQIQVDGLNESVAWDVIEDIYFSPGSERIIRPTAPDDFSTSLIGYTITEVFRCGKQVVFVLVNGNTCLYMTSHLRMTGRWLVDVPEEQIGHNRITFNLKSGKVLRYGDVRVFGTIHVGRKYPVIKGVDVLDSDYTDLTNAVYQNPKAVGKTIKQFILDQKTWTGLGNVYANETLHQAGIHPGQPADSVVYDWSTLERLIESMKTTLYKGQEHGGLSLKDWFHVDGTQGKAQDHLCVYKRTHCSCGTPVVRDKTIDSRTTYYCPECQRKRITQITR